MKKDCNYNNLWKAVHQYGFVLIELMLYLDTHPDDKCVIAEYEKIQKVYNECRDAYAQQYGPLQFNQVQAGSCFTWATTPMPWEMEVYE